MMASIQAANNALPVNAMDTELEIPAIRNAIPQNAASDTTKPLHFSRTRPNMELTRKKIPPLK